MSSTFLLVDPVLVKPLTAEEQEVLQRHGCSIRPFPETRPDILKGHRITFPTGMEMEMVSLTYSRLLFPDGYRPVLIFSQGWYSFCGDALGLQNGQNVLTSRK